MQKRPLTFHVQGLAGMALVTLSAVSLVTCCCTLHERLSYSANSYLHQLTEELIFFCQ